MWGFVVLVVGMSLVSGRGAVAPLSRLLWHVIGVWLELGRCIVLVFVLLVLRS